MQYSTFSSLLKLEIDNFYRHLGSENRFFRQVERGQLAPKVVADLLESTRFLIRRTPLHLKLALHEAEMNPHRRLLQSYFSDHLSEENGHHVWAQNDLVGLQNEMGPTHPRIAAKMIELVEYVEDLIETDVILYLPYILYAEYMAVVAVPSTLVKLENACGISQKNMTVFSQHASLDQDHVGLDCDIIDRIVSESPEYKAQFHDVLQTVFSIYAGFLDEITGKPHEVSHDLEDYQSRPASP